MAVELYMKSGLECTAEKDAFRFHGDDVDVRVPLVTGRYARRFTYGKLYDDFEFENLPYHDRRQLKECRELGLLFVRHRSDVPDQHMSIVRRPTCPQLFSVFTGFEGGLMGPAHRFLQQTGLTRRNVVMFRDVSRRYYSKGISPTIRDISSLLVWLEGVRTAAGIHRQKSYCLGVSMGAFSAIQAGHYLKAPLVYALAPTKFVYEPLADPRSDIDWDLLRLLKNHNGVSEYRIFYNKGCEHDSYIADSLGELPGVKLFPQEGVKHDVITSMAKAGVLERLLPEYTENTRPATAMDVSEVAEELMSFLTSITSTGHDICTGPAPLALDSLGMVQVAAFAESRFGVSLPPEDLYKLERGTLDDLCRMIVDGRGCDAAPMHLHTDRHLVAKGPQALEGAPQVRLAVLATFQSEYLEPVFQSAGRLHGFEMETWFGPFGQLEQPLANRDSELWQHDPHVIWLAIRLQDMHPQLGYGHEHVTNGQLAACIEETRSRLVTLARTIRAQCDATLLVSNLFCPTHGPFQALCESPADSLPHVVADANQRLARDLQAIPDAYVFDHAGVIAQHGRDRWFSPKLWYMAKADCSHDGGHTLARFLARAVSATRFVPAKCIAVDLDNTLWGGVLGDDGPDNLILGDDYPGNTYKDFQRGLMALNAAGFVLAIISKNDERLVKEVLDSHPEMLLRTKDFACIKANWDSKHRNMREIADELNIALGSIVFLDDNPVEIAEMQQVLPAVRSVQLPPESAEYLTALHAIHELDLKQIIEEDLNRSRSYTQQQQRRVFQAQTVDLEGFLAGLEMTATVGLARSGDMARIAQLVGKTNQFNLTSRRHSRAYLDQLATDNEASISFLRLTDRFGDLGLVCVGILVLQEPTVAEIDTFLMSCRVMGRGVEDAFLSYLAEQALRMGASTLLGRYVETEKSVPVRTFYPDRGFRTQEDGSCQLDPASAALIWPTHISRRDA